MIAKPRLRADSQVSRLVGVLMSQLAQALAWLPVNFIHPRAESFELQVYYLTCKLLRSSGVPQSVVYPTQASGVISTPL